MEFGIHFILLPFSTIHLMSGNFPRVEIHFHTPKYLAPKQGSGCSDLNSYTKAKSITILIKLRLNTNRQNGSKKACSCPIANSPYCFLRIFLCKENSGDGSYCFLRKFHKDICVRCKSQDFEISRQKCVEFAK